MSTCVDQLLTGKIFQVRPDSTIAEAVDIMRSERISCMLVVDDGQAVGIMTERDVMRLVHQKVDITQPVSLAMSSPVLSTGGDTSIYDAYEILKCGDIRHLVVTRYGKVAGVLTHSDLLRAVGMLDLLHKKSVIDVMLPGVSRVAPDDLLSDVIALMFERAVTTVVVTHNRKPIGIITERDIPRVVEELRNIEDITVAEVMSSPVITVDLHVSAYDVSELLYEHSIRQIIAIDCEGNLAGIITQDSLLTVFESRYIEHMRTQLSHAKQRLSKRVLLTNIMHSEIDTAIIALDSQMVIANSNPAASKIFSYQDVSLEGHTLQNVLIHGHFPSLDQNLISRAILEEGSFRKTIVRGDGSCTAEIEFSAIRSDDEIVGYLLIANDMTEHLALEQQFQQSQKMESLGTLVGGIAHDFNNMLAGMTGNLYLARSLISENAAAVARLDVVEKLSFRAAKMIKQLMTFARKDSVQMKLLGLSSFFQEVLQLNGLVIPENIAFHSEIAEGELVVLGDETQLQQVVMNLLNNAHDAVWEVNEPKITLRLGEYIPDNEFRSRHRDLEAAIFARISIIDNGCGISQEELSRIFDPFYTTKEVGKGTGLGLAMAYGAVQNHHGVMEVESSEGEGSSFHIYLPLVKEAKRPEQAEMHFDLLKGQGETILLVDDEQNVREIGEAVLKSLNYKVLIAADGEEAVEIFNENCDAIDLVILDLVMPRLGGDKAAEKMRKVSPEIPVIFATGYDRECALACNSLPDKSILITKPYQVGELSQVIRRLL